MPVIVASEETHPFLPSLGSASAIERARAERQDIRPLEIAILNLMADKMSTERQLAGWLGATPLQVHLTFVGTDAYVKHIGDGHESKNTPSDHILKFYRPFSSIRHEKFDGLIVTGVNALKERVSDETFWPDVVEILNWSRTNVLSSLYLCWGAKAALKHFHDIESYKGEKKTLGLFDHKVVSDRTNILFGFPDRFPCPVSRWKNPDAAAVSRCEGLDILAHSDESGPNMMVEPEDWRGGRLFPRRLYVLNHPEYETGTLAAEYKRDSVGNPAPQLPLHYFPGDDPTAEPVNSWRHTAQIYINWVRLVYEATPFDRAAIPKLNGF